MRKLYLHVGVHRTGTTSTQRMFRDHFPQLLQRGYLYPYGVERHEEMVRRLRAGVLKAQDLAEDLARRAESHPTEVHSVILSDEDMSMVRDFALFAPLAERFEVKVVCMLRRQDLWLESWYLQNVKWQWDKSLANLSFEEFMARRETFFWIDYAARFAHFESLFGPACVLPGVFERADMPEGPTAAVLRLMGIEDLSFLGPEVHQNSSLSPLMSEFLRHLPLNGFRDMDRLNFELAAFRADRELETNGARLMMDHALRHAVMEGHAAGNATVAARYFARDRLFRDPLPAPDAPLAERSLPAASDELMQRFVIPYILGLGRQLSDQRERIEGLGLALEEVRRTAEEGLKFRRGPSRP